MTIIRLLSRTNRPRRRHYPATCARPLRIDDGVSLGGRFSDTDEHVTDRPITDLRDRLLGCILRLPLSWRSPILRGDVPAKKAKKKKKRENNANDGEGDMVCTQVVAYQTGRRKKKGGGEGNDRDGNGEGEGMDKGLTDLPVFPRVLGRGETG